MVSGLVHPVGRSHAKLTADVRPLVRAHVAAVEATMVRRRSMTESLQLGLLASFGVIQDRLDEHLDVARHAYAGSALAVPDPAAQQMHQLLRRWWHRYVDRIGVLQDRAWQRPVPEMARLIQATMAGFVRPYSGHDDVDRTREVVPVFAFNIARQARRRNRFTQLTAPGLVTQRSWPPLPDHAEPVTESSGLEPPPWGENRGGVPGATPAAQVATNESGPRCAVVRAPLTRGAG